MKTTEWIEKVKQNESKLRDFIGRYHPGSSRYGLQPALPITAPGPEAACENVRKQIQQEQALPTVAFDDALKSENFSGVYYLLQSAWFGVLESTSCWSIEGFKEAVDLLDDPPELMYDEPPDE